MLHSQLFLFAIDAIDAVYSSPSLLMSFIPPHFTITPHCLCNNKQVSYVLVK